MGWFRTSSPDSVVHDHTPRATGHDQTGAFQDLGKSSIRRSPNKISAAWFCGTVRRCYWFAVIRPLSSCAGGVSDKYPDAKETGTASNGEFKRKHGSRSGDPSKE